MEPKEKTKNNRDSILEEIAKNDNPSLYNKELTYKDALLIDDYGYSLIEYVSKYKSFKDFKTLIESCKRKKIILFYMWLSQKLFLLGYLYQIKKEKYLKRLLMEKKSEK